MKRSSARPVRQCLSWRIQEFLERRNGDFWTNNVTTVTFENFRNFDSDNVVVFNNQHARPLNRTMDSVSRMFASGFMLPDIQRLYEMTEISDRARFPNRSYERTIFFKLTYRKSVCMTNCDL